MDPAEPGQVRPKCHPVGAHSIGMSAFPRSSTLARRIAKSFALSAWVAVAANAQGVVRGTVVSRTMPAGVSGAVVLLFDAGNVERARALTGDNGQFAFRAVPQGRYSIRTLRIGFRPSVFGPFALAGDTTLRIAMQDLPAELPPITSNERTKCQIRPDSGLALATLWEDAKTALLATAITREQMAYQVSLVDHTRIYDYGSDQLRSVEFTDSDRLTSRTWVSMPPETLRKDGYVTEGSDSTTYIAPDIETLLSPYFVETHCFRLGDSGRDSLIAIDFDPVRKVSHVEVSGRIWLDARTHELRAIDFHYVNIVTVDADRIAGGRVQFLHLRTGGWLLSDWTIRFPLLRWTPTYEPQSPPPFAKGFLVLRGQRPVPNGMRMNDYKLVIDAIRVSGGTLRSVMRDADTIWARPKHSLEVRITNGDTHAPLQARQAIAYLSGSRQADFTDTAGTVRFDRLVEGSYIVEVGTPELDVLGWPRTRMRVDLDTADHVTADIHVAGSLTAARAACLDDAKLLSDETGVLIGTVSRGDQPVAGREVTVSWIGDPAGAHSGGTTVTRTVHSLAGDGRFYTCGVPRDRPLEVRVLGDERAMTARIARDRVVGLIDVALKP